MNQRTDPERVERLIRQYADGEKEAYDSATALQDHTDRILTWLLGLMGAGLIAGIPLLKSAPSGYRALAVAPWLIGIVAALGGRVIARLLRSRESLWHFEKAVRIRMLLLERDPDEALAKLLPIVSGNDPKIKEQHAWTLRHATAMERAYYVGLALFGAGAIAVVAVATTWP